MLTRLVAFVVLERLQTLTAQWVTNSIDEMDTGTALKVRPTAACACSTAAYACSTADTAFFLHRAPDRRAAARDARHHRLLRIQGRGGISWVRELDAWAGQQRVQRRRRLTDRAATRHAEDDGQGVLGF